MTVQGVMYQCMWSKLSEKQSILVLELIIVLELLIVLKLLTVWEAVFDSTHRNIVLLFKGQSS